MNAIALVLVLVLVAGFVVAKESRRLSVDEVAQLVQLVNAEQGNRLDPVDVLAVIEVESGRDPQAFRAEPAINDASRGLMQVLYSTARDRGFSGPPQGLFDPLTNVRIGMAHLNWGRDFLRARLGREPEYGEWIGAYNRGVGDILIGNFPALYTTKWARARADLTGGLE